MEAAVFSASLAMIRPRPAVTAGIGLIMAKDADKTTATIDPKA